MACVLLLRFAQVYPDLRHSTSTSPASPSSSSRPTCPRLTVAATGRRKWDWTASLDVPLNLVIAYALVRDDPAMVEAGQLLGDPNPRRTIERDLFRASAEFVRAPARGVRASMSLQAYRGMLAVGRLLGDPVLVREATDAAGRLRRAGFLSRRLLAAGRRRGHRRVLGMLDGWIDRRC